MSQSSTPTANSAPPPGDLGLARSPRCYLHWGPGNLLGPAAGGSRGTQPRVLPWRPARLQRRVNPNQMAQAISSRGPFFLLRPPKSGRGAFDLKAQNCSATVRPSAQARADEDAQVLAMVQYVPRDAIWPSTEPGRERWARWDGKDCGEGGREKERIRQHCQARPRAHKAHAHAICRASDSSEGALCAHTRPGSQARTLLRSAREGERKRGSQTALSRSAHAPEGAESGS